MHLLFVSFGILVISAGLSALVCNPKYKKIFGCAGVCVASFVGLISAIQVFLTGASWEQMIASPIPGLSLAVGNDPLSAFFLIVIFGPSLIIAVYSWNYLAMEKRLIGSLPFFPLLVAAMAAVVCARDGFFFLICWEVMSLASFFLVTTEHENREVRHAGWIYLIAMHLATAFLAAFFVLLSRETGSFLFVDFERVGPMAQIFSGTLFVFAVIGFGTKAGIFPFHVWLPHAHPAAPSYISALMSAVMIKTGIYGILRALTFLPAPPAWWGGLLMILGVLSACMGILNGAVQKDFKRLLAYSSVENIGIMFIGLGLGIVGLSQNKPELVFLGFGGALFHLWNHALFKGALFLAAGQILHVVHSKIIDDLGGMFKKMPVLGTLVLILSVAISGLPPLNGFISEALIYVGLFHGVQTTHGFSLFITITAILGLAFAGALTVITFTKFFGMIFLGEARTERARTIVAERFSPALASCCLLVLLCGAMVPFAMQIWTVLGTILAEIDPGYHALEMQKSASVLINVSQTFFIFCAIGFFCWLIYRILWGRQPARRALTWDCGYAFPSQRMQYTGSSFTEPLAVSSQTLLKPFTEFKKITDFFPKRCLFSQQIRDNAEHRIFFDLFQKIDALFARVKNLQKGRIQESLALIFGTLVALLLWEVWIGL